MSLEAALHPQSKRRYATGMLRAIGFLVFLAACSSVDAITDAGMGDAGSTDADAFRDGAPVDSAPMPAIACNAGFVAQPLATPIVEDLEPDALQSGARFDEARMQRRTLSANDTSDLEGLRHALAIGPRLVFAHVASSENRDVFRELRAARIPLVEALHGRFFVLRLSDLQSASSLLNTRGVRAVTLVQALDKIDRSIDSLIGSHETELLVERVNELGTTELAHVRGTRNDADELAREHDVLHVAREFPAQPLLEEQRAAVRADEVTEFSLVDEQPLYAGFTGRGVRLAINDSGIELSHPDFQNYDAEGNVVSPRVIGVGPVDGQGHGTSVGGIAAGNGRASATHFQFGRGYIPFLWRGIAPEVDTIISVWMNDPVRAGWLSSYTDQNAYLSNHSHTLSVGDYNIMCSHWDNVTRYGVVADGVTRPARPTVFAAANSGVGAGSSSPLRGFYAILAPLKNSITVGATYTNDSQYAVGSSAGPTLDGRMKPDVMAPGFRDTRPPEGLFPEIDEIRIEPREGSSAPPIVFAMDATSTEDGWGTTGVFSVDTTDDGLATGHLTGVADDTFRYDPPTPINAADYDNVSFRMRLPIGGTPGQHRFPLFWVVRFSHREDRSLEGATYPTFDDDKKDAEWHTHTTSMAALGDWTDTITRVVVTPVVYDDRPVSPWVGGGYERAGGTSMAAPVVSGIYALMMEAMTSRFGTNFDTAPPLPSLFRALVIHTARDMERAEGSFRDASNPDIGVPMVYAHGPDFATGYGLVDARNVIDLILASDGEDRIHWSEFGVDDHQLITYEFDVDERTSVSPLRATLAWDDIGGSSMLDVTESQLVNDLDLVLVDPNGVAHSPWTLTPLPFDAATYETGIDPIALDDLNEAPRCASATYWQGEETRMCEDHLNNVEQVVVDTPIPGRWRLLVRGYAVSEGPQPFSVVLTQTCE